MKLRRRPPGPEPATAVMPCHGCHRRPAGDAVVLEIAGERMTFCSRECCARWLRSTEPHEPTAYSVTDVGFA